MAIKLQAFDFRGPIVDRNGNATPEFQRWMTLFHLKTGGAAAALPVSLGGTGGTTIVESIAVQTSSASAGGGSVAQSGSNASTQRKTFLLNPPSDGETFALTNCQWDTAFPDASYTVYAHFNGRNGTITVQDVTKDGFVIRLENSGDSIAAGSADCIGVHP